MSHFFGCLKLDTKDNSIRVEEIMNPYFSYIKPIYESVYTEDLFFIRNKTNTHSKYNYKKNYPCENDHYVIAGVGRIDNREELKERFNLTSISSDLELILNLFSLKGQSIFIEIKGEFAFAIFDKIKKKITLLKDRIGIKPLFYIRTEIAFMFSTNMRALIPFTNSNGINKKYIAKSLKNYPSDVEETFFSEIIRLKPAHILTVDHSGKIESNRYWDLKTVDVSAFDTPEKIKKEFLRLFNNAIKKRIEPFEVVGCQLSGGIDSSSITVLTSKLIPNLKQLHTYSFVLSDKTRPFSSSGKDEQITQQIVLDEINLPKENHHQIKNFYYKNFKEEYKIVEQVMGAYAETDSIWQDSLFKKAEENKVQIILSGFGGDELISSSGKLYYFDLIAKLKFIPIFKTFKIKGIKLIHFYVVSLLRKTYVWHYPDLQKKRNLLNAKSNYHKKIHDNSFAFKYSFKKILKTNILQAHNCLRAESENAYANQYGIEVAYPLLDIDLITFTYSLPSETFKPEKINRMFFRKMCEGILPQEIIYQPKQNGANTLAFSEYWKKNKMNEIKNINLIDQLNLYKEIDKNQLDEIDRINLYLTIFEIDYYINLYLNK
jgi:asparagine synthase (glutamine-hydrolysing)